VSPCPLYNAEVKETKRLLLSITAAPTILLAGDVRHGGGAALPGAEVRGTVAARRGRRAPVAEGRHGGQSRSSKSSSLLWTNLCTMEALWSSSAFAQPATFSATPSSDGGQYTTGAAMTGNALIKSFSVNRSSKLSEFSSSRTMPGTGSRIQGRTHEE